MSILALKPDTLDYSSSVTEFYNILATKPAWVGNLDNQTGRALIDFVATLNVFAQQKLLRALQEAFPDTAVSDRAIYAHASSQGVRIRRKVPASASVQLSSTTALAIPPFTQFYAGGTHLFNRDALFLYPNTPQSVTLHEGVLKTVSLEGLGSDYQMYVPFETGFVISDQDVQVKIDGVSIPSTTVGVWSLKGTSGFEDRTLPDGRLAIAFGTSVYGSKPSSTSTVEITYALTFGLAGDDSGLIGTTVSVNTMPTLSGSVTTALSGGIDELPALQYKNLASQTFGTFGSAVTKRQYLSTARQYEGIVDVAMFAQREIDPSDLRLMNTVKVVPLTVASWTPAKTVQYLEYLNSSTMFTTKFYVELPVASPKDISVNVSCYNWANLTDVKTEVTNAITKLFTPRSGFIDYDIYRSDLFSAIRAAHEGVEYFEIVSPEDDLIISAKPVPALAASVQVAMGSLPVGTHYYGIGVTVSTFSGTGYIKPHDIVPVTTTAATDAVHLAWEPAPNAVTYHIYGRSGSGLFEIATVPASSLSFLDTGSPVSATPMPSVNSVPVQYLTLNTLNVTTAYSKRQRS